MKNRITISLLIVVFTGALFIGAEKDDGLGPYNPTPLILETPKGWPEPNDIFKQNKLTIEGFELGKKLFYDPALSKDGTLSCAGCHQQFAAFSTFNHDLSHGINNTFTNRNAPALFNLAWMKGFHWDGGINHIEVQPLSPLISANEMGNDIGNIISYLSADAEYPKMFKAAFGDKTISSQKMLKALAQFTGSLVSCSSKYDRVKRGEAMFTEIENRGYQLFQIKCAECHLEPLFTDNSYRNNGQPLNRFKDVGRMAITGRKEDSLKFKVPTLRNIQVTFPFMHDGSMFAIPNVLDHYRNTIEKDQPTLDPFLKNGISISDKEVYELMYFLFTLTDSVFLKDERFSGVQSNFQTNH